MSQTNLYICDNSGRFNSLAFLSNAWTLRMHKEVANGTRTVHPTVYCSYPCSFRYFVFDELRLMLRPIFWGVLYNQYWAKNKTSVCRWHTEVLLKYLGFLQLCARHIVAGRGMRGHLLREGWLRHHDPGKQSDRSRLQFLHAVIAICHRPFLLYIIAYFIKFVKYLLLLNIL